MKAKIDKNLFRVKDGWVITNDEPIELGDWIYSSNNNTSSLNTYYKINKENPIGFGGSHYNTEQGVGILINSCKKIIGTIDFKIDGLLYTELPFDKHKFSERDIRIACDYYRSGYTIDTIIYLLSEIKEIEFDNEFNIKKIKYTKNEKK